ncbi:unnamed protein product [Schistosoma curassoni]|nr:unnamed protein product [Schistosoma curassoni]
MSINNYTSGWSSFSILPHVVHPILHMSSVRKHSKRWNKQSEDKIYEDDGDDGNEEHITDILLTFVLAVDSETLLNRESTITRPKSVNSSSSSLSNGHNNFMYFHLEYSIMNKEDFLFSTDVVVFSKSIAKIYPTNCSSKLINPCEFNDTLWIVWTEQIPIVITDETIIDFWNLTQTGGIHVKCWDQREKCSIQTRFDRPRSVNINSNKQSEDNLKDGNKLSEVQSIINMLNSYRKNPTNVQMNSSNTESVSKRCKTTLQSKTKKHIKYVNTSNQSCSSTMKVLSAGHSSRKTDRIQNPVESWGTCCLVLQTGHLFRINPPEWIVACKPLTHTNNVSLNKPPLSSVTLELESNFKDILVGMKLSNSLMSDRQRQKFQPIILTIDRLRNLPVTPYRSYEEMRNKCEPIRLVTTFSDVWSHQSGEYVQDKEIYMDEVQVILTHDIPGLYLRELVQTFPVVIDVYDRVCHGEETTEVKQLPENGLFCAEPDDDKIGKAQPNLKTDIFSKKCIGQKTSENSPKISSPTGRIVVNLSEMICLKCMKMKQTLPVLPMSESDLDLLKNYRSINENPRSIPRSYIGYVDSQCEVSIEIEININMDRLFQIKTLPENTQTIERMIFILEKPDKSEIEANYVSEIIEKIQLFIIKSNARSIGISDELPLHMIKANLNSIQSQYMPCIHSNLSNFLLSNSSNNDNNSNSNNNITTNNNSNNKSNSNNNNSNNNDSNINNNNNKCKYKNFQLNNQFITGFHLNDQDFNLIILEIGDHLISQYLENLLIHCLYKYNQYSINYSNKKYNNVKFFKNNQLLYHKRLYTSLNWYLLEYKMLIPINQLINKSIFYIRDLLPRIIYCAIYRIINIRLYYDILLYNRYHNIYPTSKMMNELIKQFCITSNLINDYSLLYNNISMKSLSNINNNNNNNEQNQFNENDIVHIKENVNKILAKKNILLKSIKYRNDNVISYW